MAIGIGAGLVALLLIGLTTWQRKTPTVTNEKWWFEAGLNPHGSERYSIRINGHKWDQVQGRDRRWCGIQGTNLMLFVTGDSLIKLLHIVTETGTEVCGCAISFSQIDTMFLGAEKEPPVVEARVGTNGFVEVLSWDSSKPRDRGPDQLLRIDLKDCSVVKD